MLLIAATLLVSACTDRPLEVPPLGPSTMTVVPGVHMLRGLGPSVAYVVETAEGLMLVDAGLDRSARRIKAEMAKLGLDWRDVQAVLLTHAHGDHTGGAEHFRQATGAKVYTGAADEPVVQAGAPYDAIFGTFYMPVRLPPHPTVVDVALEGGETFTFGAVRVQALATPGHSPGSICYLVERDGLRMLFSGDVIMRIYGIESPRHELPGKPLGTYTAYLAPRYRGDAEAFLASLHRLRALPVPDLVLPGHPDVPPPQNPQMTQERWEALLDEGIRAMTTLLARRTADGADFLDGHPKELLPDLYYLGDVQGTAVYGFFAASTFVLVDAPGGPGLADVVQERLEQLGRDPVMPTAVLLTSVDPEATAGLRDLVERTDAQVVVSAEGLAQARDLVPSGATVLPGQAWAKQTGIPATPIPLQGRGVAPMAYRMRWHGKTVLFSGRIPIRVNKEMVDGLVADFMRERTAAYKYVASLGRLQGLEPDVWLPLVPTEGQNANLYDRDWELLIEDNRSGVAQVF